MPLMEPMRFGMRRAGGMSNLSPEDEDSLLRSAARSGLSGLGKVGNLLDLPGSVIRDLITFLPGGPAPVNPLDQLLSPLSGENRTSGRDLLEGYGMRANRETGMGGWLSDPGEGLRDVAGFGAEVLLDPLMYLTGGASAVGKGGKFAKSAGLLDDLTRVAAKKANVPLGSIGPRQARLTTSLDDLIAHATDPIEASRRVQTAVDPQGVGNVLDAGERAKPVGGLAGVQPPFMDPIGVLGTGRTAQKVAGFLDKYSPNPFAPGSAIANSKLGLSVGSLMDATRQGKLTKEAVPYAQAAFRGVGDGLQDAKGYGAELADRLAKAGLTDSDSAKLIRKSAELIPGGSDPAGVGGLIHQTQADDFQKLVDAGYAPRELEDVAGYSFRQSASGRKATQKSPTSGISSSDQARQEIFKGHREGTVGVEDVIADPRLDVIFDRVAPLVGNPAFKRKDLVESLANQIRTLHGPNIQPTFRARNADGDFLFAGGRSVSSSAARREGRWNPAGEWERLDASGAVVETLTPKLADRVEAIADYMLDHPEVRKAGLFTNHPVVDAVRAKEIANTKLANADAAYGLLSAYAKPAGTFGKDGTTVGDVLRDVGLTGDSAIPKFAQSLGRPVPTTAAKLKELRALEIPKHIADDWRREIPKWNVPESLEPIQKAVDSFTNLFKASVLTWPARYVRDLMSGQARNIEAGMWDSASAFGAHGLLHGDDITGAARIPAVAEWLSQRGLAANDKTGTDALRQLYAKLGPGRAIEQNDIASRVPLEYSHGIEDVLKLLPGQKPSTVGQNVSDVFQTAIGRAPGTTRNPLDIRGVGDRTETKFGPVAAGEKIGRYTDDMNRLVPFINQLKQGVDPAEAMRRINEAQVDYSSRTFTPTEQAIKRLLPFYSFTSRQIKYAGKTLAENPGGGMGQSVRAINAGRDNDAMLPEHIADTAAIPLPARVSDGTKRYLTGLGAMLEDPLSMIGGPRQTGLEVLSRMNPLVKGPLEWATGQTFFQKSARGGRSLDDLDPTLGRILANLTGKDQAVKTPQALEAILGNSPLTRVLTSARQVTDSRKTVLDKVLGLGTGVRVSDVSPAAQDAMLREWLQDAEKKIGGKMFTKSYIPDEVKAAMEPEQRAGAEKLEMLMNVLQRRTKERREAAGKR